MFVKSYFIFFDIIWFLFLHLCCTYEKLCNKPSSGSRNFVPVWGWFIFIDIYLTAWGEICEFFDFCRIKALTNVGE